MFSHIMVGHASSRLSSRFSRPFNETALDRFTDGYAIPSLICLKSLVVNAVNARPKTG